MKQLLQKLISNQLKRTTSLEDQPRVLSKLGSKTGQLASSPSLIKTSNRSSMPKKSSSSQKTTVAKKVAAKAPVKKVVAKKTVNKKPLAKASVAVTKEPLLYADNETSFWVADGNILNSLVALHEALLSMSSKTFSHHVTKQKNDFSEWVKDVLYDADCAAALKTATTPKRAALVVAKALQRYSY